MGHRQGLRTQQNFNLKLAKTMAAWNFAEENLTTAITFRCHKTTSETTKTSRSAPPSADPAPQPPSIKAEPGGSTLSRSIFAFLENRDNTNVDSNPTKTSMNLKNLAQGNFSNWPNASPSRQASSDTWRPHQTERGTVGGTCEEPVVHLEGVLPPVVQQLSLNDHDQHDQHDGVVEAA